MDVTVLTSLAVEAAEPLMEVLLVLHARPVSSQGLVFVFIAGPLSSWRFCCVTKQPEEERRGHKHLDHTKQREKKGLKTKTKALHRSPQFIDSPTQSHYMKDSKEESLSSWGTLCEQSTT